MTAITTEHRESFETIALPHLDSLYRFATRLAGNPQDAEDLVQEAMLKAYRAWDRFEDGGNVRAWLMTIVRNTFLNQHRRERRAGVVADVMEVEPFVVFDQVQDTDPEGSFFDQLVDDEIWQAINSLPHDFRETLVLRDVEDLSYDEIAKVLGIKVGTVKSRLFRARQALQSLLYDYAVEAGYVPRSNSARARVDRDGETASADYAGVAAEDAMFAMAFG